MSASFVHETEADSPLPAPFRKLFPLCASKSAVLSTVHCGIAELGRSIAATILTWLEEGKRPEPETLTAVELVIRDTSGLKDIP